MERAGSLVPLVQPFDCLLCSYKHKAADREQERVGNLGEFPTIAEVTTAVGVHDGAAGLH
jgi:hypothetical protein